MRPNRLVTLILPGTPVLAIILAMTLATVLAALPSLTGIDAAHAQVSLGSGGPSGPGGGGSEDSPEAAEAKATAAANAPPPALPGAVPSGEAAPASHTSLDMNPTAALFDAINRGDLGAAKDALSRGADLAGSNVLGEKPIEMAIDLNRNDITFLLLSMRNADADAGGSQIIVQGSASNAPDSAQAGGQASHVAISARSGHGRRLVEEASARRPQADGGTPKPEIGFLGFDGS